MAQNLVNQFISGSFQKVLQISGSQVADGTGSLVSFLDITSSFAVSASYAVSASHEIIKEVSSSYADYAQNAGFATSSLSASYAANGPDWDGQYSSSVPVSIDSTLVQINADTIINGKPGNQFALRVNTDTGSLSAIQALVGGQGLTGYPIAYQGIHNQNGQQVSIAMQFDATDTGSIKPTWYMDSNGNGSRIISEDLFDITVLNGDPLTINAPVILSNGATGSLLGTASHAINADTAISASHAVTASYALNAGGGGTGNGFPFTGSAVITGDLIINKSGSAFGLEVDTSTIGGQAARFISDDSGSISFSLDNFGGLSQPAVFFDGDNSYFQANGNFFIENAPGGVGSGSMNFTSNGSINATSNSGSVNLNAGTSVNLNAGGVSSGVNEFGAFYTKPDSGSVAITFGNFGGASQPAVFFTGDNSFFQADGNMLFSNTSGTGSMQFASNGPISITSNTTGSNQGVNLNARNFSVNLSETGSGAGSFSLNAPGFALTTPRLLLSLDTASYGNNPTTANMVFTAEDSFFSALGNFYIKNIFDTTGSVYVWSENQLTLRGDTSISLEGDTFSNPTDPITVTTRGAASLHSSTDGIMGFYPEIDNFTRVLQNQRAFVETPLVIAGGGTVEVQSGATLKVINEL